MFMGVYLIIVNIHIAWTSALLILGEWVIYQQRELIADKYGAQMQQLSDHLNALDAGYMKHNVVYPNQTISGFVLVEKHRKAESTSINVIIDGVSYIFSWKTD